MIDAIFNVGDDALASEFQITLGRIPYLDTAGPINLRCTTVEIPETLIGEYEYQYKSEKIVKPNGQIQTAKEFAIEFRVDKNYLLYKAFLAWNNGIVSPVTGGAATDSSFGVSAIRAPITVSSGSFDIEGNFKPTLQVWTFTGCWPKAVGGFTLDNSSGEPLLTSVRFGFLSMR